MAPASSGRVAEKLGLSLATGLLFLASIEFLPLGWLGFLCLVPLLVVLAHPRYDARWYWAVPGLLLFELWKYSGTVSAFTLLGPVALSITLLPPYLLFALVVRFVRKRWPVPLVVLMPLAWTTVEWIRIHFSVGNLAHLALGTNLFVYLQLIQIADLFGIYGLSALAGVVNGAIADAILAARRGRRGFGLLAPRPLAGLCVAGVVVLASWAYGVYRLGQDTVSPGPRVAVVQPNLPHKVELAYEVHRRQFLMSVQQIPPGSVDLVAWPENAIMDVVDKEDASYLTDLQTLARSLGAPVYVGGFGWVDESDVTTNGMWYVLPSGEVGGRYDKRVLAPFTEYMPLEWLFEPVGFLHRGYRALVRKVVGSVPSGYRGKGAAAFPLESGEGQFRFGTMTCSENVIPDIARESVALGSDFMINPTSEGNLGRHIYYNTWANCVLRAVENRVGVVRAGNNGISGFIGPDGQGYGEVRGPEGELWLAEGVSIDRVMVDSRSPTFFTKYGRLVGAAFPTLTVVLMVAAVLVARRRRDLGQARTPETAPPVDRGA